jgi:hypothetical protein
MSDFINLILSNRIYLIITLCVIGVILFFVVKKALKLFLYAVLLLAAFLAYVYFFK